MSLAQHTGAVNLALSMALGEVGVAQGKLIYGGQLVRRWSASGSPAIDKGALYEEDGRIVAIGAFDELRQRYPNARQIGGPDYVVMPGLVNSHSHGRGITTYQAGQPDEPLELRLVEIFHRAESGSKAAASNRQASAHFTYLDTLYSCAKQLASGITTTVHSHTYLDGTVEALAGSVRPIVEAYRDSGMRCAFTLGIRDRNSFTFLGDEEFVATLPPTARGLSDLRSSRHYVAIDEYLGLIRELAASYPTVSFQLGPWNPIFCSDKLLEDLAQASRRDGWRIQTHLNETRHQAAYGLRQHGKSWVQYLREIGMLTERFSGAHGVWLEEGDIEAFAQSGAQVVYNPSSNLRLNSGLAPVRDFLRGGVKVGFGLDSLSLNDDEDMFQDLRFGKLIQGSWGIDGESVSADAMLEMASAIGALVAGIEGTGTLSEGGPADVVLLSRTEMEGLQNERPLPEKILKRARAAHVKTVIVGGRVMIEDGRWTGRDPAGLLRELAVAKTTGPRELPASVFTMKEAVRNYVHGVELQFNQ
jgi:5-methylthioadenosine/S-adenosylhomocysteine deaminase